jgi:hypothetical protein
MSKSQKRVFDIVEFVSSGRTGWNNARSARRNIAGVGGKNNARYVLFGDFFLEQGPMCPTAFFYFFSERVQTIRVPTGYT